MSHIIKENKFFLKNIRILIIVTLLILTFFGLYSYTGNKMIYLFFSIINIYLIFFSFRKKAFFFETFFSILLFLGFWFKFTMIISFTDGIFREGVGNFDYSENNFDYALLISLSGIIPLIIFGHLREFFFYYPNKIEFLEIKNRKFVNNRKNIILFFLLFIFIVTIFNGYLKIYQKGLIPLNEINFFAAGGIKWLLLFGLSTISCLLIFLEVNIFKKLFSFTIIVGIFETFLSSLSMISRGMIFNSLSIIYGIYKLSKKTGNILSLRLLIKTILVTLVLFYISVIAVNYIRSNYFYIGKSKLETIKVEDSEKKIIDKSKKFKEKLRNFNIIESNNEFFYLAINRWVGIDSTLAVSQNKDILNFHLLFEAINERADFNAPTFYEKTFFLEDEGEYKKELKEQLYVNVKGNTLTGIIAFLFYSGSFVFLFFGMLFLSAFASIIEFICYYVSGKNLIFCSLIGQIIAFRFIHFGYLPKQSYLLFGSIFLTIFFVFIFNKYLKK